MANSQSEILKIKAIKQAAHKLKEAGDEYKPLIDLVGDATLVFLGESTHGTHEFYRERAQITQQLISKKGFKAVAIEGDWPDAHQVHRYVIGESQNFEAVDALKGFTRFPSWMWANADILDFVGWLKNYNESLQIQQNPIGFYGLDLYSLYRSASEIIDFLDRVDREAAHRARIRFSCLERFGHESQKYGYALELGLTSSCEKAVVNQLLDILKNEDRYRLLLNDRIVRNDEYFNAEQNSRLVVAAEHYYRTMLNEEVSSWNLRDQHMMDTIDQIRKQLQKQCEDPKIVVWAHNSHIGNALATEMSHRGEHNIGQLAKRSYTNDVVSIGFTTFEGTVTAASSWNGVAERMKIRPALSNSYEALFHNTSIPRFFLNLLPGSTVAKALQDPMLERAIGVIYLPQTERLSHYFHASLPFQFDAVIHIDRTRAVEPIERETHWERGSETPEGYPTGV